MMICDAAHRCATEPCRHKRPHSTEFANGTCGPGMICADSTPKGILSRCIKLDTDNTYREVFHNRCPRCDGRGFNVQTVKHVVSA